MSNNNELASDNVPALKIENGLTTQVGVTIDANAVVDIAVCRHQDEILERLEVASEKLKVLGKEKTEMYGRVQAQVAKFYKDVEGGIKPPVVTGLSKLGIELEVKTELRIAYGETAVNKLFSHDHVLPEDLVEKIEISYIPKVECKVKNNPQRSTELYGIPQVVSKATETDEKLKDLMASHKEYLEKLQKFQELATYVDKLRAELRNVDVVARRAKAAISQRLLGESAEGRRLLEALDAKPLAKLPQLPE